MSERYLQYYTQHELNMMFSQDAYSFGVILWELWKGLIPWDGLSMTQIIRTVVVGGTRLVIPSSCPSSVASLINDCFGEADSRPSFVQMLEALTAELSSVA